MTFCNKNCDECTYRQELSCEGCTKGPGTWLKNDCEIAACARDKGHENCGTCEFSTSCGKLMEKDRMPQNRLDKMKREKQNREMLSSRAELLGKWMRRLFLLVIPMVLSAVLSSNTVRSMLPGVYNFGSILNVLIFLLYGIFLLKMSPEEGRYKTAGMCRIVVSIIGAISIFIASDTTVMLIGAVTFIFSITGEHNEYKGHSAVLKDIDDDLSEKWEKLWKWYIGMLIAVVAGMVVMFLMAVLGIIVLLVALIGLIVVSLVKIVYIYHSADALNTYAGK